MYAGERLNSITHLIGVVLALAGTVALMIVASRGDGLKLLPLGVYGLMLVVLYLSSTLYHSLRGGPAKELFHLFDHCAIYLLIAGTYTPLTLITLRGRWGWTLFAIVWSLALIGVLKDVFLPGRYRPVSVVLYVLMGWLIVIAFRPLQHALPMPGIQWLLVGGLFYTVGIVFFALSKRLSWGHGVWHVFVMIGSICHYIAVWRYVAMPNSPLVA